MIRQNKQVDFAVAKEVYTVVLQGFNYLSDWNSKILQQTAWKYARPNTDPAIESSVEYERVSTSQCTHVLPDPGRAL